MTSIARVHADWLRLIEASGFVSLPVLKRAFPQGLAAHDPDHFAMLREAHEEWEDAQSGDVADLAAHRRFVRWVLTETLGFTDEMLAEGQRLPAALAVRIPEHGETLRPDYAVVNPAGGPDAGKPRLLVQVLPPGTDPERALKGGRWAASPYTRMMELLRGTNVRLGLVTDGERWMLVHAPSAEATGFATWFGSLWLDEKETLRAFRDLLGARRFFGVATEDTLEALLAESAKDQHEVTDQLGFQVRKALEVLIQTIDRINRDCGGELLRNVWEKDLYDAGLTVMMRLVFLFAADERGLLLLGDPLYDAHYAVSTMREQLREDADQFGEEVLERRHAAWSRILATFRAVHAGLDHDALRIPAYGGTLFDPDRYPFLEGRRPGTRWKETSADPLPIDDRTVLHLLDALQVLQVKVGGGPPEAQRLSFRALDIEQIGHVYEGLLDHTAKRATVPVLGLKGSAGLEPQVSLTELEAQRANGEAALVDFVCESTGRSARAVQKNVEYGLGVDDPRFVVACDNDPTLYQRVRPFAGFLREDSKGMPVVIPTGSIYVAEGTDRRSTGTHYTPRSLTEPIVQYTLEPLVYDGPSEGKPKEEWSLRSPNAILGLRICDLAMGSAAFLVQTCRYLSERLVEAWEAAEQASPGSVHTIPGAAVATGTPSERVLPRDADERLALARRYVAERCLYGVDVNPMAVELAKLSLWLTTLQKGRPFTFLDHALKCGDSLLGVTSVEQIEHFHIDVVRGKKLHRGSLPYRDVGAPALARAVQKRRQLESFAVNDIRDADEKARLLREADDALETVRLMGDLIVGSALASATAGSSLDDRLLAILDRLSVALAQPEGAAEREYPLAELRNVARRNFDPENTSSTARRPFHWIAEYPELFLDSNLERRGFDAIVGNPPFMGGQIITPQLGAAYRAYLVSAIANGQRGSADLCTYFLLRACQLLNSLGMAGLLTTNTIAQGETRLVGLERLTSLGCELRGAVSSMDWPGDAALAVAVLWISRRTWRGIVHLDGRRVAGITPDLSEATRASQLPKRLPENKGRAFKGSSLQGAGFLLAANAAESLLAEDPIYRDVIFRYLGGADITTAPDGAPRRYAINFFDWSLETASRYPKCLDLVRASVMPARERAGRRNKIGARRAEYWWRYDAQATELYAAVRALKFAWAIAKTSKYLAVVRSETSVVFSADVIVVASDDYDMFAVLASAFHSLWAERFTSTLETRLRYTVADAFRTFAFPRQVLERSAGLADDSTDQRLETIGRELYEFRTRLMEQRGEGVTRLYNAVHDPRQTNSWIAHLRQLHSETERVVADAYGWSDLDTQLSFWPAKDGVRFTFNSETRMQITERLLALNLERYAESSAPISPSRPRVVRQSSRSKRDGSAGPDLFESDPDGSAR